MSADGPVGLVALAPMNEYTRREEEKVAALRPLLTPEFLSTLTEAARTCGWGVDYTVIVEFVEWCYDTAGVPWRAPPDLNEAHDYSKT